jgi:WD40 repeat protein
MCVAFHPTIPSLLAAGTFNGEVMVWDLNKGDEPLLATSRVDLYFHREPVCEVKWFPEVSLQGGAGGAGGAGEGHLLASLCNDGKMFVWNMKDLLEYPLRGFQMRGARKGARGGVKTGDVGGDPATYGSKRGAGGGGGVCMAFSSQDSFQFVLGSEMGSVYKCTREEADLRHMMDRGPDLAWTADGLAVLRTIVKPGAAGGSGDGGGDSADVHAFKAHVEKFARERGLREVNRSVVFESKPPLDLLYPTPVSFEFAPHDGPVHDVQASPFSRNVFLTCSSDSSVKMYSLLQKKACVSLQASSSSNYLYSTAWSHSRPCVFAASTEDGRVLIYDFEVRLVCMPALTLIFPCLTPPPAPFSPNPKDNTSHPVTTLFPQCSGEPVYTVEFNQRYPALLAAGDGAGKVHLYSLNTALTEPHQDEEGTLERIISRAMDA